MTLFYSLHTSSDTPLTKKFQLSLNRVPPSFIGRVHWRAVSQANEPDCVEGARRDINDNARAPERRRASSFEKTRFFSERNYKSENCTSIVSHTEAARPSFNAGRNLIFRAASIAFSSRP